MLQTVFVIGVFHRSFEEKNVMAMFLIVRVRNDSRKCFLPRTCFYIPMTSGAETVDLILAGTGGGVMHPPMSFFSKMAAEAHGGSS